MKSMNSNEIIIEYQSMHYEKRVNNKMMYYDYVFPIDDIHHYISEINNIDCAEIMDDILSSQFNEIINSSDVFQFSSFENCTDNLCAVLKRANNSGVKPLQMGKMLLNDGENRKEGAFTKYGENHLKTALLIGLVWKYYDTYYLTCLGYALDTLSKEERNKLITRLLLRNKLIRRVLKVTSKGKLDMRQFCYMLSDSTYIRRRSNLKRIFKCLEESDEYPFDTITENIIW